MKIHHGQMIQQARKSHKKRTKDKETNSPIEKYHSKINHYINHRRSN